MSEGQGWRERTGRLWLLVKLGVGFWWDGWRGKLRRGWRWTGRRWWFPLLGFAVGFFLFELFKRFVLNRIGG